MEKEKKPLVSVITPAYNSEKFIERTIKSVLSQTFTNFELIIVDDASTDKTKEIVENFQKKDRRIKYIKNEKNSGGPAKPLNMGIKESIGDYIAILESDDEWMPEKLEKQINFLKNNSEGVELVSCGVIRVYPHIKEVKLNQKINKKKDFSKETLKTAAAHSLSSIVFKKKIIKEIGLFDENLKIATDKDFYIRIFKKFKFGFIREALFYYYIHGNNISRSRNFSQLKIKDIEYLLNKHEEDYKKYPSAHISMMKKLYKYCLSSKKRRKARKYILKSIRINPLDPREYLFLIITFLPNKYYSTLIKIRLIFLKTYYFTKKRSF